MPTPAVHCRHTRLELTSKLKPHPANPNEHPAEQLRIYAKILAFAGWRRPIVVSRRSGCIIKGHGAWQVAKAAGWQKVPIEVQDYPDAAAELEDLLADNQLARYANVDKEALQVILDELKAQAFDLELAGILPKPPGAAGADDIELPPPPLQLLIQCENEKHQVQLLRRLTAEGLNVRAQIT